MVLTWAASAEKRKSKEWQCWCDLKVCVRLVEDDTGPTGIMQSCRMRV